MKFSKNIEEFLKAQATSIIATAVDYGVTFLLKEGFLLGYLLASIIGTTSGGIVNFLLGRNWAFSSKKEKIDGQALKFLMVWTGNLLLNAGGMRLLTDVVGIKWWISKIVVSVIIGIGYNYVLQKFFVFKKGNVQQIAEA